MHPVFLNDVQAVPRNKKDVRLDARLRRRVQEKYPGLHGTSQKVPFSFAGLMPGLSFSYGWNTETENEHRAGDTGG